jgi:DNA-binding transcriptional LysR family regulator
MVAEHLHFGRAALALNISQPPLSRQIRDLEKRLGVVLFNRGSGGIQLTNPGEMLLLESRRILDDVAVSFRRVAGQSGHAGLNRKAS